MTSRSLLATCLFAAASAACAGSPAKTDATPAAAPAAAGADGEGWISLFNGRDLTGWKASENPATFRVENGEIVVHGPRAHLFYVGADGAARFTSFEWKADVLTRPNANSGMYFHTEYQETGWPAKGYEVQVNSTHGDWRKTGGLYGIVDVKESPSKDDEWFTQHVIVQGKRVIVKVNGNVTVDYTEPENVERPEQFKGRLLGSGTVALQGHDPGSEVRYKNILLRPLP